MGRSAPVLPQQAEPVETHRADADDDDDDAVFEVARPELSWQGRFADPAVDDSYVQLELKPILTVRVSAAALCCFVTAVIGLSVNADWTLYRYADSPQPSFEPTLQALVIALALASAAMMSSAWFARDRQSLPGCWLSCGCTVLLMFMFTIHLLLTTPALLDVLARARAHETHDVHGITPLPSGARLLRLFVIPVLTAVLLPLEPLHHVSFTLFGILLVGACHIFIPTAALISPDRTAPLSDHARHAADQNSSVDVGIWVGLMLVISLVAVNTSISRRTQAHFLASIIRNLRTVRHLSSADAARAIEMASLEAARTERQKLLRMVMHDLRSPALSMINLSAALLEQSAADDPPAAPAAAASTSAGADAAGGGGRGGSNGAPRISDQTVVESLKGLSTCAVLMERIVSDMLDFERISGGRLVLLCQPFSLRRLLEDVRITFNGLAASKSITLALEPLPEALAAIALVGDERRLQQCLNNGLSNAIKFTEPGGRITLSAGARDDDTPPRADAAADADESSPRRAICLRIEDDGIGLTASELVALNRGEDFVQVGKGQLQGNGGTGLGLSIVRHILDLHDGSTLAIESDGRGRGTRFCLNLNLKETPLVKGDGAPGAAADGDSRPVRESVDDTAAHRVAPVPLSVLREGGPLVFRAGFRLLYVEDDKVLSRSMQLRLLKKTGATCLFAENGREAVDAVRALSETAAEHAQQLADAQRRALMKEEPTSEADASSTVQQLLAELPSIDLILIDNQMPVMTGEQATRALRAMGYRGVIIGLTGDPTGSPDRAEFEAAGLDACFDKDSKAIEFVHGVIRSFAVGGVNYARAAPLLVGGGDGAGSSSADAFSGRTLHHINSQLSARALQTRATLSGGDVSDRSGASEGASARAAPMQPRRFMELGAAPPGARPGHLAMRSGGVKGFSAEFGQYSASARGAALSNSRLSAHLPGGGAKGVSAEFGQYSVPMRGRCATPP